MVIASKSNLTLSAVQYIQGYARAGLPIILSGGDPGVYATHETKEQLSIQKAIRSLKKAKNVYSVPTGQVAMRLQALGLPPQVFVHTNGTWYSTWREDAQTGVDHAFIFCDTNASTGTLEIASSKIPFLLEPWTGVKKPLVEYTRSHDRVTIHLSLAANQTIIIGFSDDEKGPGKRISKTPSSVIDSDIKGVSVASSGHQNQSVVLSDGTKIDLPSANAAASIVLSNWTLTAEHWEAPSNISDASIIAAKHNTTHHLSSLVSWRQIEGLTNSSGLGYYTTEINWPPRDGSADGAYLFLPAIAHTARIYLNGRQLPPLDLTAPRADITKYLKRGSNQIKVIVPTTMWNYIRSISNEIQTVNDPIDVLLSAVGSGLPAATENGLIGEVRLVPYVRVKI